MPRVKVLQGTATVRLAPLPPPPSSDERQILGLSFKFSISSCLRPRQRSVFPNCCIVFAFLWTWIPRAWISSP